VNILDQLITEHLMAEIAETDAGTQRATLVDELAAQLHQHMAVEEQFLYPIVTEVLGDEPATEGRNEHDLARAGLVSMDELAEEPGFSAALEMVKAGLAHHVHDEESDMFPRLRRYAAERIGALDHDLLAAWVDEQASLEPTRDELYERAQDIDVPGRSTMTKPELADATAEGP
jgi:iron-sulfur cluster repair protein YtfE (RIC family)